MSNVAIIGEKQYIYGFGLLGMKCFYVDTEEDIRQAVDEIRSNNYALVFALERWMEKMDLSVLPTVVPLKDNTSNLDLIKERLKAASLSASGVDLTKR